MLEEKTVTSYFVKSLTFCSRRMPTVAKWFAQEFHLDGFLKFMILQLKTSHVSDSETNKHDPWQFDKLNLNLKIYTTLGYIVSLILFRESETRVPSSRGLVKQYNQELCMSSNFKCFTKRLQSRPLNWNSTCLPRYHKLKNFPKWRGKAKCLQFKLYFVFERYLQNFSQFFHISFHFRFCT